MEEKEMVKFKLPKETVIIKPNISNPGWIKNPKHRAFFLMEGTAKTFMAPLKRTGGLTNVLTDEEKICLEEMLYMKDNELSVYKKPDDNFWTSFTVRLTKDPLILDLSKPYDYIKYKILLSNTDLIAPSVKNIKDKRTYKFYIERQKDIDEVLTKEADLDTRTYVKFSEVSTDARKIVNILKVYAESFPSYGRLKNISAENNDLDFLKGQLGSIVGKDKALFLEVTGDKLFDTKVLISRALDQGIIERKGTKYYIKNDPKPFGDSLKDACNYIDSDIHQEFKLKIETELDD